MNLDTLSIARNLRAAELPSPQAEAIAAEIGQAFGEGSASRTEMGATLVRLEASVARLSVQFEASDMKLAAQLEALEQRLVTKVETLRFSLLVWLIGIVIAASGLLVTIGRIYFK